MKLAHIAIATLLLCINGSLLAQRNLPDSVVKVSLFEASVSLHEPGGDLKKNFGTSTNINLAFHHKTKKNWTLGTQVSFITGRNVKNQTKLVSNIISSTGSIGSNGKTTQISMDERGMNFSAIIGKIYPIFGPNKNSGLWIQFGMGYIYHKIKIEDIENTTPIFSNEEILKGYDNLTAGISTSQGLGYVHLSNQKVVNFYIGLEFIQGFTKNQRKYSYLEGKEVTGSNFDSLIGIKLGWFIPTYKRESDKYHLY